MRKDPDGRNEYHREWRRKRIENGLCVRCGRKRNESPSRTFCLECAHKHRQYNRDKFGYQPRKQHGPGRPPKR